MIVVQINLGVLLHYYILLRCHFKTYVAAESYILPHSYFSVNHYRYAALEQCDNLARKRSRIRMSLAGYFYLLLDSVFSFRVRLCAVSTFFQQSVTKHSASSHPRKFSYEGRKKNSQLINIGRICVFPNSLHPFRMLSSSSTNCCRTSLISARDIIITSCCLPPCK